MKKNLFRSPTLACLFLTIFVFFAPTSCKLSQSHLSGAIANRGTISPAAAASDILVQDSVHFIRSDSYTSGTLSFQTKVKVKCEIDYWTKDTQNHPQIKACQQDAGGAAFSETISPIPPNENLSIKLYFWPMDEAKSETLFYRIDENADFSALSFKQLITGRLILPLESMEVYEVNLDAPKKLADINAMFSVTPGCSATKAAVPNPFAKPNKALSINNLSTTGFATGPAAVDTQDSKRLSIYFQLLQMNQDWTWNYKYGNTEHQLVTKAPGYLNSLQIVGGGNTFPIKNKNLSLISDGVTLTGSERELDWTPLNLTAGALLFIQFTGEKTGNTLTCIFSAAAGKGTIPDNLASNLPADVYDFLAIMQSSQIVTPTDGASPTWVITAQDWRYSRLAWKTTL